MGVKHQGEGRYRGAWTNIRRWEFHRRHLKDSSTGKNDLIKGISWNNAVQIQEKKTDQRKEWVETGKVRRREKVWCLENQASEYIQRLVDWEEETRYSCKYINFGCSRINNTSVFQKHGKIHIVKSWPNTRRHRVVRVLYLRLFFVQWLTKPT